MKDHIMLAGMQIDDFCTELFVEVDDVNTILTFEKRARDHAERFYPR